MTDRATKTVVNAWNEWDPLKHVIVGRVEGTMVPAPEPGMVRHLPDTEFPAGEWGPLPDELVEKGRIPGNLSSKIFALVSRDKVVDALNSHYEKFE